MPNKLNAPPPRSHAVAPWPRILCAAPGYVERWGAPAAPHSLNAHRIAVDETVHDGAVWRLSATAETVEFHVTPRLRCEGDEVLQGPNLSKLSEGSTIALEVARADR